MSEAPIKKQESRDPTREGPLVSALVIALAIFFMAMVLFLPLMTVFVEALRKGVGVYLNALKEHDALAAIKLTLLVTAIVVPLNTLFGISTAWAVTKFDFWGKSALMTFVDLPFSISPVISGLVYVLVFGLHGWLGPTLDAWNVQIIFTVTGICLATLFVTFPFVARELIPLMQSQGADEESAAATLGASGWRTFWFVTLPNIKWALMYGVLLCTARAMGEFGAVSVVSGKIRGMTNTMPLHIEVLYNEYSFVAAFAVASLLAMFALVTLGVKTILETQFAGEIAAQRRH